MLDNFMISLEIMYKGMAGIFVAILLLTLAVMIMGKVLGSKKKVDNKEK